MTWILAFGLWLAWSDAAVSATPSAARLFSDALADTVERVMPSVVVIRTESRQVRVAQDWLFGHVYRIPERLAGQGSGVIIDRRGYVLTNNHVIDGATDISIVLDDGSKYPARLVGVEPHTDLAVLKIEAEGEASFHAVEIGDSDRLRVGEFVVAIGSPFSLASSVTLGIVSQKGRSIGMLPYEDFIQTDAAINRGNSGGPLVDVDGAMIGVNTVIQTTGMSQGSIGIGFAIPVNLAMRVARSIIENGVWERPWIGIQMSEAPVGVRVVDVVQNSPASHAGVQVGDLILRVDEIAVNTARDVQRAVLGRDTGHPATLSISRSEEEVLVTIVTEAMPSGLIPVRRPGRQP
ncbi:MAG TPA: trypsin-like peptidase domain-containing protein [Kiritimatiellia bacterium]|nr:trypsin-like peptidase domain-containing protein [Kiritimatiellia bacterium]